MSVLYTVYYILFINLGYLYLYNTWFMTVIYVIYIYIWKQNSFKWKVPSSWCFFPPISSQIHSLALILYLPGQTIEHPGSTLHAITSTGSDPIYPIWQWSHSDECGMCLLNTQPCGALNCSNTLLAAAARCHQTTALCVLEARTGRRRKERKPHGPHSDPGVWNRQHFLSLREGVIKEKIHGGSARADWAVKFALNSTC